MMTSDLESQTSSPGGDTSRRQFLKAASLTLAGAALATAGCGAGPAATVTTSAATTAPGATSVASAAVTTSAAATSAAATATSALASAAPSSTASSPVAVPTILTSKIKDITLRQIGTGTSGIKEIANQAKKDLGFTISMKVTDTDTNNQMVVTQPAQFDIFDGEFFSLPLVVPSKHLQPLDTQKIAQFSNLVPLFTTGKLTPAMDPGQGTAPYRVMFLTGQDSTTFAAEPTRWANLIPTIYNADTLGYRPDLTGKKIESWGELFNPQFKGKTALINVPSIGIMDVAMVTEALGLAKYVDKGNMTRAEIDKATSIAADQKKAGQFRAFWKSFDESVNFMTSGEVELQSMWSPAVTAVKAKGIQCVYPRLKEGYRGWGGGLGLAKHLTGIELDAAYEYMNWWLSGWPGAFISRQGYYSSIPDNAKKHMSANEWGYWYDGKAATADIKDPYGVIQDKAGAVRDGGSFLVRMTHVACWNSIMKEQDYLVKKWNEFIAS